MSEDNDHTKEMLSMSIPCEQKTNISRIQEEQALIRSENKKILENQSALVTELKDQFGQLKAILMTDVEHKKDIEQLKKESDILFNSIREHNGRLDKIEVRNARCDGAGIEKNFPKIWNWYQQEQGWRRFIPAAMAVLAWIATMFPYIKG